MSKSNKVSMPSGIGGLTRYFDDYKSSIQIKPGHVVIVCIVVMIIILLLHVMGGTFTVTS
ncbi:preprotein translocase subunit Sec61beta [Candidatus Woesearchaeota archaeon]|jgi:preprotein translocase subunit Sec61beta|nr:preprotein translocase subunit Sec61beta [Candidatus Woesearchaeota archaeon]